MGRQGVAEISAVEAETPVFSDSYSLRDYEVVLDLLYGLFTEKEATQARVFDPFVRDTQRAPLLTPRMLTDRIEALLAEFTNA